MVTVKDIAKEAGVSPSTVSNVINNRTEKVSEEKARQIREIIAKYGYAPNSYARSLSQRSSHVIAGIIVGNEHSSMAQDPYNAEFFSELINGVQERGYYFMFQIVSKYEEVLARLNSWSIDGAIIVGLPDNYVKELSEKSKMPLIFTDSYTNSRVVSNIGINDYKGGELAARHLLERGHRRVGFVGYRFEEGVRSVVSERYRGFCDVLAASGVRPECQYTADTFLDTKTFATITDDIITGHTDVTALFITADKLAYTLMDLMLDSGIRIPEDISVIGFDDLYVYRYVRPKITTIQQDIVKKAQMAVDSLFRQLEDPQLPAISATLDVSLVDRGSVL